MQGISWHIDALPMCEECPPCWNGDVELKGTMRWIYFIMNKAFVWGAHILNWCPESKSSFELSGQRHHRTDALLHIHLVSHTGGPPHLSFWLSSVSSEDWTIGQLKTFMQNRRTAIVPTCSLGSLSLQRAEMPLQIKTTDYIKNNIKLQLKDRKRL